MHADACLHKCKDRQDIRSLQSVLDLVGPADNVRVILLEAADTGETGECAAGLGFRLLRTRAVSLACCTRCRVAPCCLSHALAAQ